MKWCRWGSGGGATYLLGIKTGHSSVTSDPMLSGGQGVVTTLPPHSLLGAPEEVLMAAVSHRHLPLLNQTVAGQLQRQPAASLAVITNLLLPDGAQPILSDLPAIKSAAPA